MANVTIPNLPQVTGTTDLDILVITDSGETTTSKITKADLLAGIGGGNLVEGSGTDSYTTPGDESNVTGTGSILLGSYGDSSVSGDYSGSLSVRGSLNEGDRCVVLGGFNNDIEDGSSNSSIILNGQNNKIDRGTSSVIAGGSSNIVGYNSYITGIYTSTACQNESPVSSMIACNNTDMLQGRFSFAAGDSNTFVFNDYEGNDTTHLLSLGNETTALRLNTSSVNSGATMMIGSMNSWIGKTVSTTADIKRSAIIGSLDSHISSSGGTHSGSFIIASTNTDIDNKNRVVAINVDGYTADTENVVVVPQLVMTEYSSLNFADDTAAAAGGVVLGGIYHNAGNLRVRIV